MNWWTEQSSCPPKFGWAFSYSVEDLNITKRQKKAACVLCLTVELEHQSLPAAGITKFSGLQT